MIDFTSIVMKFAVFDRILSPRKLKFFFSLLRLRISILFSYKKMHEIIRKKLKKCKKKKNAKNSKNPKNPKNAKNAKNAKMVFF